LNYTPNEFDILEFMYELPKDLNSVMHAQYFPKLYTFDIETEISSEFPDPDKAEQKVTAISLVGPDLSCIVYGLHKLNEDQIALFRKRYLDWINENEFARSFINSTGKQPKVLYQYFPTEEDMLTHFFTVIIPKIACLAGWNSYGFDMLYLVNRITRLFGKNIAYNMIRKSSPTGEIKQYGWEEVGGVKKRCPGPCHSIILDYMQIVKDYDYILRPYESYSLDWVGNAAVKAHKIKYQGTLQDLYERDPEWYYFYNAVDSLITMLIHYKLKSIESPCAVSSVTLVPLQAAFGQVALGTANVFEEFYNQGQKVVWDYDSIERTKIPYEGAFCGCVPGRYEYTVCFDFASLYPSQVRTCNLSFENFYENKVGPDSFGRYTTLKWTEADLEKFRQDPNYFVTVMGNVYKNDKDYAFRRIQANLKVLRDKYKYTGQRIESEFLVEIDNILKGSNDHIEFHQDIVDLMKEKFNKTHDDLYAMENEELKKFRVEVEDLRHEYSLLELAHKVLMNGLYGACANQYFFFFNASLAADITGECRHLTKTMWHNLEEWFHEGIWTRKDLWQEFGFELDESKHDWYRKTPVSVYSDTDSVYTTFGNFFKCMTQEYQQKYDTPRKKVDWVLNYCKKFQDKLNNKWCEEIYNPRHGKNVHEFELETISYAQICIKKKKYLKGYAYVKGKYYDTPKVSGTGIEIIKSTTPKLCRTVLKELMNSLMFDYHEENRSEYILQFNEKLAEYRRQFYKAPVEDISQSVGVGDYKKYVVDDTNSLQLGKQCPVSVQAIARFNYLAHKNNEDNKKQYSGKIKYYNIRINEKTEGYFGFPSGELPQWAPKMDKITQWQKTIIDPINRFLEVMDIPKVNASNTHQLTLF
jgi:DNA polymerase elongation subunit (family B)